MGKKIAVKKRAERQPDRREEGEKRKKDANMTDNIKYYN